MTSKKITYPVLLLIIVSLINLYSLLLGFSPYLSLSMVLWCAELLAPLVFLLLLLLKKEKSEKAIGIAAIVFACVEAYWLVRTLRNLLVMRYSFMELLLYGGLKNVLFTIVLGLMLLYLGVNLLKQKKMTAKYNILFGIAAFLTLYGSMLMAVADPSAILWEFPSFLYVLALWYLPRLFDPAKVSTTAITTKKITVLVVLVVGMFLVLAVLGGLPSGPSHKSDIAYDPDGFLGYSDSFWDWYVEHN